MTPGSQKSGIPSIRSRWPNGFIGWLAYYYDYKVMGYKFPVDWCEIRALEDSMNAIPLCVDGGIVFLDKPEKDILLQIAKGIADETIASSLNIKPETILKFRQKLAEHLGIVSQSEIASVAALHGLQPK